MEVFAPLILPFSTMVKLQSKQLPANFQQLLWAAWPTQEPTWNICSTDMYHHWTCQQTIMDMKNFLDLYQWLQLSWATFLTNTLKDQNLDFIMQNFIENTFKSCFQNQVKQEILMFQRLVWKLPQKVSLKLPTDTNLLTITYTDQQTIEKIS